MIVNWLRTTKTASTILLLLRLFLGYKWFSHGLEKATEGFSAAGFAQGIVDNPVTYEDQVLYPWFNWFIEHVALPGVGVLNVMVPAGELLIGLSFISGCFTQLACFFALLMNFSFVFGGTVSENPMFILIEVFIVVAGANASRWGLDYWVIPWVRRFIFRMPKEKWPIVPALANATSEAPAAKAEVKADTSVDADPTPTPTA